MAKIKSKVTKEQVAKGESRDYEEPQPGRYNAAVHTCEVEGKKRDKNVKQLHVAYQIDKDHPKYGGSVVHERVPLPEDVGGDLAENTEWKYTQFLIAMGLLDPASKKKSHTVEFDTDDIPGTAVLLRVKAGSYNGEYRAEVGTVLPRIDGEDDEGVEDEDVAEVEDDDLEDEGFDEEAEDEDEDDFDEDEAEELTAEYIDDLDADGLKELMAEYELKKPKNVKGIKGVRAWLKEELLPDDEDDEEDPF